MARESGREVKARGQEKGGVEAVPKTAFYLPQAGSGLQRPKRGGPVRPVVGHVGPAKGKSLGRGCLSNVRVPAWLFPFPEVYYDHMP